MDATEFIHIFLRNSPQLIDFLEHMHKNHLNDSKIIANTLLELYIKSIADTQSTNKKEPNKVMTLQEKKVLEFLTSSSSSYDTNLALILCQLYNFRVIF